jgi:predicted dehydrogenase
MRKVKWGILGAARIARTKVIPGMRQSEWSEVAAIASRDMEKAREAAGEGVRAYGSYDDLLADPNIDVVYNPLPSHLHVPWSIRAAEAGKHVLCEKPISLSVDECRSLMAARDRAGVVIGEAFMVRTHPQWLRARELAQSDAIGQLTSIVSAFSYYNRDPANVRNVAEWGGGGLMDIGCYPIHVSRFLFGEEPVRVSGTLEFDPEFRVDRLASAVLEFPSGHCVFTCGTQMTPYQTVQILGTAGRVEIEIPFNAPPDRPCRIFVEDANGRRTEQLPVCDQYAIQADAFSRAVIEGGDPPVPLEDSIRNMAVIEAVFEAARSGRSIAPARL